jgi:alkylation response protein AidB-like acyl-CoA dehydrogenase
LLVDLGVIVQLSERCSVQHYLWRHGAARSCLEEAMGRLVSRQLFRRAIGAMLLSQQKLAKMFVEHEKCVLLAVDVGWSKDAGPVPHGDQYRQAQQRSEAIAVARSTRSVLSGDGDLRVIDSLIVGLALTSFAVFEWKG